MDTVIAAPASCEVRAVIRFLHAEGQSAAALSPSIATRIPLTKHKLCGMSQNLNSFYKHYKCTFMKEMILCGIL